MDYALGQWSGLEVFLRDGRVEIDNNLVENAIRPTAIGKKNWLFMGDAGAGQRGAIIYTIIESCRRRAIDPYAYLRHVLERLLANPLDEAFDSAAERHMANCRECSDRLRALALLPATSSACDACRA